MVTRSDAMARGVVVRIANPRALPLTPRGARIAPKGCRGAPTQSRRSVRRRSAHAMARLLLPKLAVRK